MSVMKSLVIWMSVLMIALAVPMAMRMVPPNSLYGFRTPKTLGDERIWYEANQKSGINLIAAGVLTLLVWGLLWMRVGIGRANFIGFPVFLVLLTVSFVVSFVQLQKM